MTNWIISLLTPHNILIAIIFVLCIAVWLWVANKSNGGLDLAEAKGMVIMVLVLYQGIVARDVALFGISFGGFIALEINNTMKKVKLK